jgi:hypothetical protein
MRQKALAILVVALVPALGMAQDSNDAWNAITAMPAGRAVKVTVGRDTQIAGTLLKASANTLIVRRGANEMTLDRSSVRRIKVVSSKRRKLNMILFGAAGMAAGMVPGMILDDLMYNEVGNRGVAGIGLGALGAGIGVFATRNSGYSTSYSAGRVDVEPLGSVPAFDLLDRRIGPGNKVHVISSEGTKIAGTVESLSATSLAIRADGRRFNLRADDVQSISQRLPDSLVNGTMWGMLGGAGLAVGATATQAGHLGYGSRRNDYFVSAAVGGGIGAAAGAVIDAFHKGKKVVYVRPSEPKATSLLRSLNFAPVISKSQKGAALSLSF